MMDNQQALDYYNELNFDQQSDLLYSLDQDNLALLSQSYDDNGVMLAKDFLSLGYAGELWLSKEEFNEFMATDPDTNGDYVNVCDNSLEFGDDVLQVAPMSGGTQGEDYWDYLLDKVLTKKDYKPFTTYLTGKVVDPKPLVEKLVKGINDYKKEN